MRFLAKLPSISSVGLWLGAEDECGGAEKPLRTGARPVWNTGAGADPRAAEGWASLRRGSEGCAHQQAFSVSCLWLQAFSSPARRSPQQHFQVGKPRLEKGRGWAPLPASLRPVPASRLGLPLGIVGPQGPVWLVSHDAPGCAGSGSPPCFRGAGLADTWGVVGGEQDPMGCVAWLGGWRPRQDLPGTWAFVGTRDLRTKKAPYPRDLHLGSSASPPAQRQLLTPPPGGPLGAPGGWGSVSRGHREPCSGLEPLPGGQKEEPALAGPTSTQLVGLPQVRRGEGQSHRHPCPEPR